MEPQNTSGEAGEEVTLQGVTDSNPTLSPY
jgi:hypothetical protein